MRVYQMGYIACMSTQRELTRTGSSVQIPADLTKPLKEFKKRTGIGASTVARLSLKFILPQLLEGKMALVNGELVPVQKAA